MEVTYVGVLAQAPPNADGEIVVLISDLSTDVPRVMTVWKADAEKLYELSKGRILSVRGLLRWPNYRRPPYLLATSVDVLPDRPVPQRRAASVVVTPLPASSAGSNLNP
jgi:hypothetical protein